MGPVKFFKNVHSKEKDEACLGFLEEIFTKSVHRGGVGGGGLENGSIYSVSVFSCPCPSQNGYCGLSQNAFMKFFF
jgi:hypothetical protein